MKKLVWLLMLIALPALANNSATITFTPPTHYTDDSVIAEGTTITYHLYQGLKGQPKELVGEVTNGQLVNTGLEDGNEYCWEVTATIATSSSDHSNESCKAFATHIPLPPVIITVE
jgi:hypothetical protein